MTCIILTLSVTNVYVTIAVATVIKAFVAMATVAKVTELTHFLEWIIAYGTVQSIFFHTIQITGLRIRAGILCRHYRCIICHAHVTLSV